MPITLPFPVLNPLFLARLCLCLLIFAVPYTAKASFYDLKGRLEQNIEKFKDITKTVTGSEETSSDSKKETTKTPGQQIDEVMNSQAVQSSQYLVIALFTCGIAVGLALFIWMLTRK